MRVTLINPNTESEKYGFKYGQLKRRDAKVMPLGLGFLSNALKRAGHEVLLFDMNFKEILDRFYQDIEELRPDILGFTIGLTTYKTACQHSIKVKERLPSAKVIWGGPFATIEYEKCLQENPAIDFLVLNEGEITLIELLEYLNKNNDISKIKGIAYIENNKIIKTGFRPYIENLDAYPMDFACFNPKKYIPDPLMCRRLPHYSLITSRGCPFNCAFCHKPIFGTRFRMQSPEKIFSDMAYLHKCYKVKSFEFVDDNLTVFKKNIYRLCDLIVNSKLKIEWSAKSRVDCLDEDYIKKMKKAGLWMLMFGIESGTQKILGVLKKQVTVEQNAKAIELCNKYKIVSRASFIINNPGETIEMMDETIRFACRINPSNASFNILVPHPKTAIFESCKESGTLRKDMNSEDMVFTKFEHPFYLNEYVSSDSIKKIVIKAYRKFYMRPSWVIGRLKEVDSIWDIIRLIRLVFYYRHMLRFW